LATVTRYTFGKKEKLKSRKKIDGLFKTGKSFSLFPFRVVYMFNSEGEILQSGFSVSSRNFKHAADRNRVKRLMREAYRLQKQPLVNDLLNTEKKLAVFFIFTGNTLPDYKLVFEKMTAAIKRLQKIVHENPAANS
jgi:ribonuclease P protein component